MANELELTGIIKYNKSGVKAELSLSTRVDITGTRVSENNIFCSNATGGAALELGGMALGQKPYVMIENLSDTAVLTLLLDQETDADVLTIPARTFAGPMKLESTNFKLKSNVSNSPARIIAIEP